MIYLVVEDSNLVTSGAAPNKCHVQLSENQRQVLYKLPIFAAFDGENYHSAQGWRPNKKSKHEGHAVQNI